MMKVIITNAAGNILNVEVNDSSCTMLNLFESNNYTKRVISTNNVKIIKDTDIIFKNQFGDDIRFVAIVNDDLYKNEHIILYCELKELLFVIPNVLHLLDLYSAYNVDVVGVMLGTDVINKNNGVDTYHVNQKFNTPSKIKLDTDLLTSMVISVDTLEIPGVTNPITQGHPIGISKVTENRNIYNAHTSLVIGLNISFDGALLSDNVNCSVVLGHNAKDLRSKTCVLPKEKIIDATFKKVYILA